MGSVADGAGKEQRDATPWYLIITVMAVLITFFIAMPVLGFMYADMYHATNAAVVEVRKMKELRRQIIQELKQQE